MVYHTNTHSIISVITDPEQPYNQVEIYYKQPAIPEAKTDLEYRSFIDKRIIQPDDQCTVRGNFSKTGTPFLFATAVMEN